MESKKLILLILIFFIFAFLISTKTQITGNAISNYFNKPIFLIFKLIFISGCLFILTLENLEKRLEYDGLIIMGRNWRGYPGSHKPVKGELPLSVPSKMSCEVAARMYIQGKTKKIITGGRKTAGASYPSEAEAMKQYILKKHPEIPEEDIITQDKTSETYDELDEDLKLAEKNSLETIALVTVDTQLKRCKTYLKSKGKNIFYYSTEEEFSKLNPHYKRLATKHKKSLGVKYEQVKETILRSLQYVGITKIFTKPLAKMTRGKKSESPTQNL